MGRERKTVRTKPFAEMSGRKRCNSREKVKRRDADHLDGKETKEAGGHGRDEFKESYEKGADAREGNKGIPPKETTTKRRPRK